jgi:hypothetical protein
MVDPQPGGDAVIEPAPTAHPGTAGAPVRQTLAAAELGFTC